MTELTVWYVSACFIMFAAGFTIGYLHRLFLQVLEAVL